MPLMSGCFDLLLCSTIAVELHFPWCESTSLNFPSVRTGTKGAKMTLWPSRTGAPSGMPCVGDLDAALCRKATDGENDLVRGCQVHLYACFPF